MFKKTEESEWTRFSRALGGAQPTTPQRDEAPADDPEPVTISQLPEASTEPLSPPRDASGPEGEPEPVVSGPPSTSYTPSPTPAISATMSHVPDLERGETIIGDGASIEGTVRSERSIRVRGAVQGEIESGQRVVVEETATVKARVVAEQVTILGEVNGSIECTGRVEIAATGRVAGEVTAGTLVIQEGAFFEGHLKMASRPAEASS
jgi:cytoskeletal protein CcmA (bactofilin family)